MLLARPGYGLDTDQPLLLILFHPVLQQAGEAANQTRELLQAALASGMQSLVIMPNADAGAAAIAEVIDHYASEPKIATARHIPRTEFLSLMAYADVMAGNSSSGIIEAASLGTPVLNIGNRQQGRERNPNVVDVAPVTNEILAAISKQRQIKGQHWSNLYGDGKASERIVKHLNTLSLSSNILEKVNAY